MAAVLAVVSVSSGWPRQSSSPSSLLSIVLRQPAFFPIERTVYHLVVSAKRGYGELSRKFGCCRGVFVKLKIV
ncbi:hypothetical protein L596_004778 [Steinernema carpocapsae]|uniref:Uncharacterized protein n=1 Tax=Steinernema carpocapsae TaxID=34508 RepID=A0A4U8V0F7_STECR|nr:hypothetical protein L596_004778 [Steinernema carpocapsae]